MQLIVLHGHSEDLSAKQCSDNHREKRLSQSQPLDTFRKGELTAQRFDYRPNGLPPRTFIILESLESRINPLAPPLNPEQ